MHFDPIHRQYLTIYRKFWHVFWLLRILRIYIITAMKFLNKLLGKTEEGLRFKLKFDQDMESYTVVKDKFAIVYFGTKDDCLAYLAQNKY